MLKKVPKKALFQDRNLTPIVRTKVDRIVDTTVEIIVHTIMHTKVTIIVRNMV